MIDLQAAVLDDDTGRNVLPLECGAGGSWPTDQWLDCVLEPVCPDLPVPSAASGMVRADEGAAVKLGESVVYECALRSEFYETPDVSAGMGGAVWFLSLLLFAIRTSTYGIHVELRGIEDHCDKL